MAERDDERRDDRDERDEQDGGVATKAPAKAAPKTTPKRTPPKHLPRWKVLLHNDDVNDMLFVVETIVMLVHLQKEQAIQCMLEAHMSGVALLLTTHQELAELYRDQFVSRGLFVTIEPEEDE